MGPFFNLTLVCSVEIIVLLYTFSMVVPTTQNALAVGAFTGRLFCQRIPRSSCTCAISADFSNASAGDADMQRWG
jgi:putative methionine-R-sulfoxide reductase with GAF domain